MTGDQTQNLIDVRLQKNENLFFYGFMFENSTLAKLNDGWICVEDFLSRFGVVLPLVLLFSSFVASGGATQHILLQLCQVTR